MKNRYNKRGETRVKNSKNKMLSWFKVKMKNVLKNSWGWENNLRKKNKKKLK